MPSLFPRSQANAATRDMVEPHAAALDACRAAMEAAGVGTDPSNGHVHVLRRMADSMRAEAAMGKVPSAWNGVSMYAAADASAPRKPLTFIPQHLDASALADVLDRLGPDLALPQAVLALAASETPYGATGHKVDLAALDKALAAATNLTTSDRIKVKLALTKQGLLPVGNRISSQGRI
jgi:hypothetical protein